MSDIEEEIFSDNDNTEDQPNNKLINKETNEVQQLTKDDIVDRQKPSISSGKSVKKQQILKKLKYLKAKQLTQDEINPSAVKSSFLSSAYGKTIGASLITTLGLAKVADSYGGIGAVNKFFNTKRDLAIQLAESKWYRQYADKIGAVVGGLAGSATLNPAGTIVGASLGKEVGSIVANVVGEAPALMYGETDLTALKGGYGLESGGHGLVEGGDSMRGTAGSGLIYGGSSTLGTGGMAIYRGGYGGTQGGFGIIFGGASKLNGGDGFLFGGDGDVNAGRGFLCSGNTSSSGNRTKSLFCGGQKALTDKQKLQLQKHKLDKITSIQPMSNEQFNSLTPDGKIPGYFANSDLSATDQIAYQKKLFETKHADIQSLTDTQLKSLNDNEAAFVEPSWASENYQYVLGAAALGAVAYGAYKGGCYMSEDSCGPESNTVFCRMRNKICGPPKPKITASPLPQEQDNNIKPIPL